MSAVTVHLALGSNVGDRLGSLRSAWRSLRTLLAEPAASSIYETAPMYLLEQPPFLNAVCRGLTTLSPRELLREAQRIEAGLGRERVVRNGPRTIDVDILLYGELLWSEPDLQIPHPRIRERAFVLVPLLELSPDLRDPSTGAAYRESLDSIGRAGVRYLQSLDE